MIVRVGLPGGKVITLREPGDLDRWQTTLRHLYKTGDALCYCVPTGVKLAICKMHSSAAERYYLRSHSSTSGDHDPGCLFGPSAPRAHPAPEPVAEGDLLHLEGGLRRRQIRERNESLAAPSGLRSSGPPDTTYLALLRRLIERAGLNAFEPARPMLGPCAAWKALLDAANLRTSEGNLASLLLALPPGGERDDVAPFVQRAAGIIASAQREQRRVVIIAEVGALDVPKGEASRFFIKGMRQTQWHCAWRRDHAEALLRRYALAAGVLGERGGRVIIAGSFDVDPGSKTLWFRYGALLGAAKPIIPVESKYELQLALRLIDEGRAFRKPLTVEDGLLPDFELLDVGADPLPLEVFGMETPSYVQRMREKIALYGVRYGHGRWWSWKPTDGPIPSLPAPLGVRRRASD